MIDKTIGQYRITEKIGEGGMGVVYKAEDTKLGRTVALKFLPEHLNASAEDKARFTQEARAASALNHPNVCTIHDIEEFDGQMFMVMEYVDGQTLREKMGSLSYKQAIEIGIQLADGLAAAHEKGIIHRDIKPENIMVRKDGIALIMDFGLAKLRGNVSRLTKQGSTIGTAGYMSPEQVQGQDADHRSDIFSLGVVLYEMMTGQPPFKGIHETALAYEIVNVEAAPMAAVKTSIDPMLDAIILECLEKDANERTQSVKQVSIDLKRFRRESSRARVSRITAAKPIVSEAVSREQPVAQEPPMIQSRLPWILTAVLAVVVVGLAVLYLMKPGEEARTVRSFVTAPPHISFAQQSSGLTAGGHIAVSPDGRKIAFVGADSVGRTQLYVRSLNSMIALPLPGTEGAFYPFWSPNSRFIAFFTQGKLKKVDASGGPPLTVCDVREARGGTWGSSDVILFTPGFLDPLFQVSAAGGIPTQLTTLDSSHQEATHRFPWFLPDGKHFLYFTRIGNGTDDDNVSVGSIDGTMKKELLKAHSNAMYANGYLLYIRDQTLVAQPFDVSSLTVTGNAVPIAEQLRFSLNYNQGSFSVSQQGVLTYEGGLGPAVNQLAYIDRSGASLTIVKETQSVFEGAFSPDAKRIAYSTVDPQSRNEDIWVYDIARDVTTRLTFDPNDDTDPVWSPDGKKIAFSSTRTRPAAVFLKNADGTGNEAHLFAHPDGLYPTSWSMDGKFITCTTYANRDILMYQATGDTIPITFLKTQFPEDEARFSPDGKWVSYTSTESGRREIYVRPFPGPGGKWQISTEGSRFRSFWRGDGKEIYYLSREGNIMAADVGTNGGTFVVGAVKNLFDAQSKGGGDLLSVSPDGQKFLFVYNPVESMADRLTLVINWPEEVGKTE